MDCPRCQRPVAVARAQCLYCGAPLPVEAVEQAAIARAELESAPSLREGGAAVPGAERAATLRRLVVLHLSGADPRAVERGLSLSAYEAGQRVRRGGDQLHRVLPSADAETEAARLGAAGLRVTLLAEAEVLAAADPLVAAGGSMDDGGLVLRRGKERVAVRPDELLLLVKGPIAREYQARGDQARSELKKVRTAGLDPGYRFHLHRREDPRPVEVDPTAFELGPEQAGQSVLLVLAEWMGAVARGAVVDDQFRFIPPALAVAEPTTSAADVLQARRPESAAAILDNVAQFRFYSAWRGLVERGRAR